MSSILRVIVANLRRNHVYSISLFVIVVVTAALLNLGLLMMMEFDAFLKLRSDEVNAPHYLLIEENRYYSEEQTEYLNDYPGVTGVEIEDAVVVAAEIPFGEGNLLARLIFDDISTVRYTSDATLVEGRKPESSTEIVLPYAFKTRGVVPGDNFVIKVPGVELCYTVTGFNDEIMLGSVYDFNYKVTLSDSGYKQICERFSERHTVLRVQLTDPLDAASLNNDFCREFFYRPGTDGASIRPTLSLDIAGAEETRIKVAQAAALRVILFALLLVIVILYMLRYRIYSGIDENSENIGSLKSIGVTDKQLMMIVMLQFGFIMLTGTLMGIGLSYTAVPLFSRILELQTGLQWHHGFSPSASALAFAILTVASPVVIYISGRKIFRLSVLDVLRGGISAHSFKHNYFSLDTVPGPLFWLLNLKAIFHEGWRTVFGIGLVVVLSGTLAVEVAVYDNVRTQFRPFTEMMFGETPDARFFAQDSEGAKALRGSLEKDDGVRKLFYCEDESVMIEGKQVENSISENYDLYEGALLYEGRYPRFKNEICLSGVLAENLKLGVGDVAGVSGGSRTSEYVVVGLIQSVEEHGGMITAMTIDGYRLLEPGFEPTQLFVYLQDAGKASEFADRVSSQFRGVLSASIDYQEAVDVQLMYYRNILSQAALVTMALTLSMSFLTAFVVFKTEILRRRHEFSIYKSLGFTDLQLMQLVSIGIMPLLIVGSIIGSIIGALIYNQILVVFTRSFGVVAASMPVPIAAIVFVLLSTILLIYVFGMLISRKVRKLSIRTLLAR